MAEKESSYGFEETIVTLTDEDGVEKDFYVDEIYEVDGKLYAAVIPADVELLAFPSSSSPSESA